MPSLRRYTDSGYCGKYLTASRRGGATCSAQAAFRIEASTRRCHLESFLPAD